MDIETRCVCIRFNIDYYYYYYENQQYVTVDNKKNYIHPFAEYAAIQYSNEMQ